MVKINQDKDDGLYWYKDAIIYEIHIKAFQDSNKDGIGDFKGLINRLDYLVDLGVTAIWLLPFYPSPQRDGGYDISDYYSINPEYGKIKQFKKLLEKAHKKGLKVITELVINHTSDQHPWFQRARKSPPGSKYRDYYVWSDNNQKYKDARIIFQDFENSNWTYDPVAEAYFWHRFYSHQPDLNFDNEEVQEEVTKIIDYWADMGVDGFRLDAIPYLFERDGTNCENLPETHTFLKKLRQHVDEKYDRPIVLLAEANMWPEDSASYFGKGDECHMNYHFPIMPRLFMSVRMEDRYPIIDILDQTPEVPENCQWAMFLRNHDELTLEMVTDEERDFMYKAYSSDPLSKINLGIRRRLAPLLGNNRKKIELMNILLYSLPGTPVLYYGDEIGMGDNFYLGDRDGVRTPMQWSPDRNAGFSQTNPQQLYLPIIFDPEYHYEALNVENQQKNLSSLLWWNKRVIDMRKRYKAFGRGDINMLSPSNAKVIAFTRTYKEEKILVVANLSRFSQAVEMDIPGFEEHRPIEAFSQNHFPLIKDHPYQLTLGPHDYFWFILKDESDASDDGFDPESVTVEVSRWEDLSKEKTKEYLQTAVLPHYLNHSRWFGGKGKTIQNIRVSRVMNFSSKNQVSTKVSLLFIKVTYTEGVPENYFLPVSFAHHSEEEFIRDEYPRSFISNMKLGKEDGIMYDALYNEHFRADIFSRMLKQKKKRAGTEEMWFYTTPDMNDMETINGEPANSRILSLEQSNTSIIFKGKYFLKIYRKIEEAINPDVEITEFLSGKGNFQNVPKFLGGIELRQEGKQPMAIGMMQELVENQGNAFDYFEDGVKRYFERVLAEYMDHPLSKRKVDIFHFTDEDNNDPHMDELVGHVLLDRARQLGVRTAEMHIALDSDKENANFKPEEFSLHYQRSMFSSLQTLVRSAYQDLNSNFMNLKDQAAEEASSIKTSRKDVLDCLKRIYEKKLDTTKIRAHGDYHLGQTLYTGNDFYIIDFEGEPARSFSERRLKRSPLRDVAGMVRSFHYAAYSAIFLNDGVRAEDAELLADWAERWYENVAIVYLKAYEETCKGYPFVPAEQDQFEILLQTFLLEKAIYEMKYELNNRPDWVIIPLRGIQNILDRFLESIAEKQDS